MATITKNISKTIITRAFEGVCFGDVIYAAQGQYGPLVQTDFQIVLILEGSLDMRVEERWIRVPSGHVVPMLPGQKLLLLFSRDQPTRHQWCTVRAEHVPPELARRLEKEGAAAGALPIPEVLHTIMRAGLQSGSGTGANDGRMLQALGEAALASFLAAGEAGRAEGMPGSEPVRRVQRFVHEHYGEELDLERLAKCAGVTPNHLIRLFREQLGVTPVEYLWQARLDHGAIWLRETGLGVAEIAYRAGFQNPFHFSRRFKERYGKAPREFRNRPGGRSRK